MIMALVFFFFFLVGFSPDKKFPQAQFSPYVNVEYKWNPAVWYHKLYLNLWSSFCELFCSLLEIILISYHQIRCQIFFELYVIFFWN